MTKSVNNAIRFEVVEDDPDYLLLRISVDNGEFSGSTDAYIDLDAAVELAAKLEGFPLAPSDRREVKLGSFGTEHAGGGARIIFFCNDGSGHAWVELQIEATKAVVGVTQSAQVILPIEAAAVDGFVNNLRQLTSVKARPAILNSAPRQRSSSLKPIIGR